MTDATHKHTYIRAQRKSRRRSERSVESAEACWKMQRCGVCLPLRQAARRLRCICANPAADVWLRARANHFSSHAKVLTSPRRRSVREEIADRVAKERKRESFFGVFPVSSFFRSRARSGFSLLETEASLLSFTPLLSRPLFPTRKRSLRRFVSEGEAVVTNFAPPPTLDFNSHSRKHNSR